MNSLSKLKVIIADDELLAREKLRRFLKSDVEILAECNNGFETLDAIRIHNPDLLFLDIEMPVMTGFELISELKILDAPIPKIVFVTAYHRYAVQAFESAAMDFLLKPFDKERFSFTMKRVKSQLELERQSEINESLLNALKQLQPPPKYLERFVVKTNGKFHFVKASEVAWIEADGNYLSLHVSGKTHLIRETMSAMEEKLNPEQFTRIHRGVIVNIEHIKELYPSFQSEHYLIMQTGERVPLSRAYRKNLERLLGDGS